MFSPDERHIILGRSAAGRTDRGGVVILSREGLDIKESINSDPGISVVRVFWHSKINQVSMFTQEWKCRLNCLLDRHRIVQWGSQSPLLPNIVSEWRQTCPH